MTPVTATSVAATSVTATPGTIVNAERIRLVGLDVDGVLTDGGIYLGDGSEYKRYDIQDGFGVLALREAGIKVAIVTGRVSESVRIRAREMRVDALSQDGQARKLPALLRICDQLGVGLGETAFVGDDFPDLAILRRVALPVAVGNAAPEIRAVARLQLTRTGGHGAVREFAELLLKARGEWTQVVEGIVASTSEPAVVAP
jgi:3-deoxy-D-manno-octulosonate 8-phosphate phosphatase (KDO 8-P phosphatase)